MSGDVVNLRRARKDRARKAEKARADASAARHGAGKAEKAATAFDAARMRRDLDGARRDPD